MRYQTEAAPEFNADAYRIRDQHGIAWTVCGWQTLPDEDTEWSGQAPRTGKLVVVMVGDDREFLADPEDVTPLENDAYCRTCGQIGCHADATDDE